MSEVRVEDRMLMESYAVHHARVQLGENLDPPFRGALYRNKRSGKEWQLHTQHRPGEVTMRCERRLLGNFGWFRFCHVSLDSLGRNWEYIGPTPEDHYLWGYDLGNPREPIR